MFRAATSTIIMFHYPLPFAAVLSARFPFQRGFKINSHITYIQYQFYLTFSFSKGQGSQLFPYFFYSRNAVYSPEPTCNTSKHRITSAACSHLPYLLSWTYVARFWYQEKEKPQSRQVGTQWVAKVIHHTYTLAQYTK